MRSYTAIKLIKSANSRCQINFGRAIYVGLVDFDFRMHNLRAGARPASLCPSPASSCARLRCSASSLRARRRNLRRWWSRHYPSLRQSWSFRRLTDFYAAFGALLTMGHSGGLRKRLGSCAVWKPGAAALTATGIGKNTDAGWFWASDESWGWATITIMVAGTAMGFMAGSGFLKPSGRPRGFPGAMAEVMSGGVRNRRVKGSIAVCALKLTSMQAVLAHSCLSSNTDFWSISDQRR